MLLAVAALGVLPALATGTPAAQPSVDPRAADELRRMSDYLASLQSFRVESRATDEMVLKSGEKLQSLSDSQVAVRRPNRLRSDRLGPVTDVVFRYDGQLISIFGKRTGYYTTAPAPPTLDATIDAVREKYGIEAPGADLLMSQPYADLMDGVTGGRYLGIEPVDGVACHHLAFVGSDVNWQIWIQDGAEPLPRRYVIVSKNETGQPEFTVAFSHWNTQANLPDSLFAFQPPPGSKRIEFLPRGRKSAKAEKEAR
jgi:hypothetical protein